MFFKPSNPELQVTSFYLSPFTGFEWGWDLFFFDKIGYLWLPVNEKGMAEITSCELIESPEELFKRCLEESIFTLLARMNELKSNFPQKAAEQKAAIRTEWEPVLKKLPNEYTDLFNQVLESERTNIIQCARILLRNTDDDYLQKLLGDIIGTQYWPFDDIAWLKYACHEYDQGNGLCAEDLYSGLIESLPERRNERLYLLYYALKRICEDGYDISGFGLVDIPIEDTFYFSNYLSNPESEQVFDMVAFNDDDLSQLQPSYLDLNNVQKPAPDIKTAIEKYAEHFKALEEGKLGK